MSETLSVIVHKTIETNPFIEAKASEGDTRYLL